jgi:hypothetical protein
MIRAELTGSHTCTALGITAKSGSPVLALCRKLIEAGHNPAMRLEMYRDNTLCLRVRSIAEAAGLVVVPAGNGQPIFKRREGVTALPIQFQREAAE